MNTFFTRKKFIIILAGLILVGSVFTTHSLLAASGKKKSSPAKTSQSPKLPLVHLKYLKYQGAFRVPPTESNGSSLSYGGTALAYNNNSLFMVGHDWYQKVAEVKIPKKIIKSTSLKSLPTATIIQNFNDASDEKMYTVDNGTVKIGGLYVYNHRLIGSAYSYYDADGNQKLSHFISPLNLSGNNDARGMYKIGNEKTGFVSGYMADIPKIWQKKLGGPSLTGQCCLAIIGRTSSGPAASVFNPDRLSKKNAAPATPLVGYPLTQSTLGKWGETNKYYNGTTTIKGMVFPEGTNSVLFFGTHGTGKFCYGTGADCHDPADVWSKGTHGYPYIYQVWAYDVKELEKVKNGKKQPWEVKPYGVWKLDLPFSGEKKGIGGVAYDRKKNLIYVSQMYGDGSLPVIHVFKVKLK